MARGASGQIEARLASRLDELIDGGLVSGSRHLGLTAKGEAWAGGRFARSHLGHILDQLLVSCTYWACEKEWNSRRREKKEPELTGLLVIAEYAAFAHQRALFELFCDRRSTDARRARQRLGHPAVIESSAYAQWNGHLNSAAAHVASRDFDRVPHHGVLELKDQVVALTVELVRCWHEFSVASIHVSVRTAMEGGFDTAMRSSTDVVSSLGLSPAIDWRAPEPFSGWQWRWWP